MNLSRRHLLRGTLASGLSAALPPLARAAEGKIWTVGVIGDTDKGGYGHGLDTVWSGLPETKIIGVSDPSETGRTKAIERLKLTPGDAYPGYREMLEAKRPELVAVCPRHIDQHHDMILAAIEAGAKGLYVEKPFCRDLVEADAIVAACEKSGAKLAIAHRNRYHPVLPVIAKLVEEGAIGRWLEIRARGKEDARGGSLDLWVLGSHLLNLTRYFTGEARNVSATVLQEGRPVVAADVKEGAEGIGPLAGNAIHARFETEKGIPVFFDSIANAGVRESGFGIQLIGTEGVIDFRADAEPLAHYGKGSPFRPTAEPRKWVPITSGGIDQPEPIADIKALVAGHHGPCRDLIAAIGENRAPLCSDRDGRAIVEMTLAIFESHRQGGRIVSMPLKERRSPLALLE
ncbi:MAG: Gfo/Idh/MocA family oxidoreductase [Verrucomicrobiales bacterium]|nr:Gfo/Idh/MocA family oxidoreductase [Verrucomicrobiales bacterium]